MSVATHPGSVQHAIEVETNPARRVVCVHESGSSHHLRKVREVDGGTPVDHVDRVRLDAYLTGLGSDSLAGALIFCDQSEAAPASLRALRAHREHLRARVYLLLPTDEPAAGFREEDHDVEGLRDARSIDAAELSRLARSCVEAYDAIGGNPLIPTHYLDSKFNETFDWFEGTRWDWNEREDFSEIRRDLLSDDVIEVAKHACIAEFGTLPGVHNFLREWVDEYSFSSWAVVWGGEEARHSLILARYLREIGVDVMAKHAMYKRQPYPIGHTRAGTLMMNMISESRASEYYGLLHKLTEEPVLKGIWKRLSHDEARHASAFFQFCQELCELDDENLVSVMEMAYVWLADRSLGMKHPAGFFYEHSTSTDQFRQSERFLQGHRLSVTDDADARVLAMIRKLTRDRTIKSTRDIKHWLREHI